MTTKARGLSTKFMKDLQVGGLLNPLLDRVQKDTSLDLEIRDDYLNLYYRGGNLLKVSKKGGKKGTSKPKPVYYRFDFNKDYVPKTKQDELDLPASKVDVEIAVAKWLRCIPGIKDTMDLWFGKHPKDERALQQMVVWENNESPWANGTDYFILDIEYDNRKGARFDLVAVEWQSSASARKLTKGYRPRLTIIEMKAGDGALVGKAGIDAHLAQLDGFLKAPDRVKAFKKEMLTVLEQKRQLGLIKGLKGKANIVKAFASDIDVVFLLAGHDPASRKLSKILASISEQTLSKMTPKFSAANLMGYGLYKENMYRLEAFKERFAEQIGG